MKKRIDDLEHGELFLWSGKWWLKMDRLSNPMWVAREYTHGPNGQCSPPIFIPPDTEVEPVSHQEKTDHKRRWGMDYRDMLARSAKIAKKNE